MKQLISLVYSLNLVVAFFLFSQISFANPRPMDVLKEDLYQTFRQKILSKDWTAISTGLSEFEQKYFVDAVWDLVDEGETDAANVFQEINTLHYSAMERFRIALLQISLKKITRLPPSLTFEIAQLLQSSQAPERLVYLILSYDEELTLYGQEHLVSLARNWATPLEENYFADSSEVSPKVIQDLVYETPDLTTVMNQEYTKAVKIFLFCRYNRKYPCLMMMKDVNNNIVRNADGTLWVHRALSSSALDRPSYKYNGNTPAGVYTLDSVMPYADLPRSFGKNRRVIMNFIPKSPQETLLKSFLPLSSHKHNWWRNSIIARNIGRENLRIHGTGKRNTDPTTPYFPFMRTLGCIAQREGTYGKMIYKDQRVLLNTIMHYLGLEQTFENEPQVKGVLYLVEIDRKLAPVRITDLAAKGIK